jgi:hypothetical protein
VSQNTSTAVMARRIEPHDSLDDFPTQPWGTRALMEMFKRHRLIKDRQSAWEPAANRGFMVRPLKEYFASVRATDIFDYGFGYQVEDFLMPLRQTATPDWIITNPPFRLAKEFALTALERARVGCALLVRTSFIEGVDRYRTLFEKTRPDFNFQFVERLPMVKGRCDPNASTATSYCWLVWLKESPRMLTIQDWIPPCRAELERPGDYPA